MSSIQYTIRNIPSTVDKRLRAQAKRTGKSFNQTVVDSLKQSTGLTDKPTEYHDLDWFFGSGGLDKEAFDIVTKETHRINPELWQ